MASVNAVVKVAELNIGNSTRAVSRFLAMIPGMGVALNAAFMVVGPLLLGKAIVDTGAKVYEFFKNISVAQERIRGAFREISAPIQLTNDQLRVSNERLEMQIAKLEGRRQNTLALALAEAKEAADKLADSLDRDIQSLQKVFKEESNNWFSQLMGKGSQGKELEKLFGGETGQGGWKAEINAITDAARADMDRAKGKDAIDAIEKKRNQDLLALQEKINKELDGRIDRFKKLANPPTNVGTSTGVGGFATTSFGGGGKFAPDHGVLGDLELLQDAKRQTYKIIGEHLGLQAKNEALTNRAAADEAAKNAGKLTAPFINKMEELQAQIEAVKGEIASIGGGPEAEAMARGLGLAKEAIIEINKRRKELGEGPLPGGQQMQIVDVEQTLAGLKAEKELTVNLRNAKIAILEQVRAQDLLTQAVGKGYEAVKAANVESKVMKELKGYYGLPGHESQAADLRKQYASEYDAQQRERSATAVDTLTNQINLENRLAEAESIGAEEVERITALEAVRAAIMRGATGQEIILENELYYARKRTATAKDLATLKAEIAAGRELADVQIKGAEALRLQGLENKYAEMRRTGKGDLEPAERLKDEQARQFEVRQEALRSGMAYRDQLETLYQQLEALQKITSVGSDAEVVNLAIKRTQDDILRVLVDQKLATGTLRDGWQAFFLEMQRQAKEPGRILYESMVSALDQSADQLAKLATGQKTSFGKMFQGLGEQLIRESIKAEAQKELGKLGEKIGIKPPVKKPTGNAGDPLHVIVDNASGGGSNGGGGGGFSPATTGGGLSKFGIWNFGGERAAGGPVSSGMAYEVGERGREWFVPGVSGSIMNTSPAASGGGALYVIDARGSDEAAVDRRVRAALVAVHGSAVATSVQAQQDRMRRVPR